MSTTLRGLSETTKKKLEQYESGYKQSAAVTNAYNYLQNVQKSKPGNFSSQYTNQLNTLYDQMMNRPNFQYDLNNDTLYKQAKEQYQVLGKQAMMDTMGQAANLTGGYGNSYASTAGNQAYQAYLQKLHDNIPEYYQLALNKYNQEGQDLNNKLNVTQGLYSQDYAQYRDRVSDYYQNYSNAYNAYSDERNFDFNQYSTGWQNWLNKATAENGDYWTQAEYEEKVRQFNAEMAEKQRQFDAEMAYRNAALAASSGGGGGGSSSGSSKAQKSEKYDSVLNELVKNLKSGASNYYVTAGLKSNLRYGNITPEEADEIEAILTSKYGFKYNDNPAQYRK